MNQSLLHEFDSLIKYITAAREIVQSGHMPDLTGMDKRIAEICATLTETDPETQQACLPKLTDILQNLDLCENEMRAFHKAQQEGHTNG